MTKEITMRIACCRLLTAQHTLLFAVKVRAENGCFQFSPEPIIWLI